MKNNFVLTSTAHGTMLVNRNDFNGVPNLNTDGGYGVGYQLLNYGEFDPQEIEFVRQLVVGLKNTRVPNGGRLFAIDCGANIGVHTLELSRLMEGWGDVLAIEAQERLFYALCGNLTLNNCSNARAVWAAVSDECGELMIPALDPGQTASFGSLELVQGPNNEKIGQEVDYAALTPVKKIAIDSMSLSRLDFLKIDVEGMEKEVLLGAIKYIEKFRPAILYERIKCDQAAVAAVMEEQGYLLYPVGLNTLALHRNDVLKVASS